MTGPVTGLVLSGQGVQGAWVSGVLDGICNNPARQDIKNTWSYIAGTSIGAVTGLTMAQYSPWHQCTDGVPDTLLYWKSIKARMDVFESSNIDRLINVDDDERVPCLKLAHVVTMGLGFEHKGGLCDPWPGDKALEWRIQASNVSKSGTRLAIAATSMSEAKAHWWNEKSPDIVEAAEASSALPPVLFPKIIGKDWYIDGSLMVSTPIVKALQDGATTVLVIQPTASNAKTMGLPNINALMKQGSGAGLRLLELIQQIFDTYFFLDAALSEACIRWPNAQILGYQPSHNLGPPIKFHARHIDKLLDLGRATAGAGPPKDLCKLYKKPRYTKSADSDLAAELAAEGNEKEKNFDLSEGIAVAIIAVSGVLGMSIGFVFSKVRSRKPHDLHGKLLQDASC